VARLVAFISVTLDGVMQAPGRPDEDTRGGFEHGGWATSYADQDSGRIAQQSMATTGFLLMGRRTYEDLLSSWNKQGGPFKDILNNTPKYVASTTLSEPLPWPNSTLLEGDAADAVVRLRKEPGKDIVVLGSGELLRGLMKRGLVDVYVLQIHPLVLGTGQRLFDDGVPDVGLRLEDSKTTSTGVIVASYSTDGEAPSATG
jgi:dihydrofolate reductase